MRRSAVWVMFVILMIAIAGVTEMWAGGGSEGSGSKVTTIKIATHTASTSPWALAFDQFKKIIEPKSGGQIKVETYYDAVLGTDTQIPELVSNGDVQMTACAFLVQYDPLYGMLEMPFLFNDFDHAQKAIKLRVFDYLLKPFTKEELIICLEKIRQHIEDCLKVENTAKRPMIAQEHLRYLKNFIIDNTSEKENFLSNIFNKLGYEIPPYLRLVQDCVPEKTSWAYLLVLRAIKYLYEHYTENLTIDRIAKFSV